jgi:hypothetical protein
MLFIYRNVLLVNVNSVSGTLVKLSINVSVNFIIKCDNHIIALYNGIAKWTPVNINLLKEVGKIRAEFSLKQRDRLAP